MDSSSSASFSSGAYPSSSAPSIVSRAKTALHSAKAKAGRVFSDLKSDRDQEKQLQRDLKEHQEKLTVEGDGSSKKLALEEDMGRSIEEEDDSMTSKSGAIPPASVIKNLGLALEASKRYSSVKNICSVKGSFVGEKTAAGFSVVKSFVLREKDKGSSDCNNEEIQSLIHQLFNLPEEELSSQDSTLASFSVEHMPKDIHAAPPKSFVVRLSKITGSLKSMQKMASFWLCIIVELRNLWSEGKPIPHVPLDEKPDLNCCLLHQQLQAINCCIARKRHRVAAVEALGSLIKQTEYEDFFDSCQKNESNSIYARLNSGDIAVRLGVDKLSGNLFMLETGEPIYSPVTQEGPILTADFIREAEEFVLRTGSLGAGCSQLLSDMQAFKAANPGCILEDFIRWHSPPDWSDMGPNDDDDLLDVKRGRLSSRMLKEGNLWRELWETAKSVPAMLQTPLFDEDLTVESILSALDDISPTELFQQLFVSLLVSSFMIAEAALPADGNLSKLFHDCKDYAIVTCQCGFENDYINDLCKVYETVEMIIVHPEDAIEITKQTENKKSLFYKLSLNFSRERHMPERTISKDHKTDEGSNAFSNLFDRKSSLFARKPSKQRSPQPAEQSSHDDIDWTTI